MAFKITKWCASITDDHKDQIVRPKPEGLDHEFRLLDADKVIYAYGYSDDPNSFAPLDRYRDDYGCIEIQYRNKDTGKWEEL
jgi:hypothetical protein